MGAESDSGEERRFARFRYGRPVSDGYWPLPPDGLCLSSFLLLSPEGRPSEVLLGRIDPRAAWGRIGALDAGRVSRWGKGWMLPSCHLLYFESPDEAARRILREQLGVDSAALEPVRVHSEAYRPPRNPGESLHWDFEFLYRGTLAGNEAPRYPAWTELRFVDPSRVPRSEFARSHDEVLELAGLRRPTRRKAF